ncbi:TULIP family P47-like protein [Arsenophonus nasoniae]|uniref:TULIP family P47-like protein n=1 Tax=Arsenophonus nasoniae TaxID=638 RepID=UPI00387A062E
MPSVSTIGWDVVSVTDINTLNKVVSENHPYPDKFAEAYKIIGQQLKIAGQWGEWRIANEANGKNVYMQCLIQNGSATIFDQNYSLNANEELSSITIQILLAGLEALPEKWLSPDDDTSSVTEETQCFELVINNQEAIVIIESNFTNPELYSEEVGLASPIEMTLKRWFNNNIDQFKQIFSVLLLGLRANKGDFQWLKPSAYSYSANSTIDKKTAAFGALTLIDGKTEKSHLTQSVDVTALHLVKPFGANAALIVSKSMFVRHILLQAAMALVKNSRAADFDISETGFSLTNNKEMVWQDFDGPDNAKISPMLPKESFILTLQADYIHISIVGAHYRPQAGTTVLMGLEQNFKYKVGKNDQGEPVFVPDEQGLGDATVSCSVVFDEWIDVVNIVLSIVTSIASLLALGSSIVSSVAKAAIASTTISRAAQTVSFVYRLGRFKITLAELTQIGLSVARGVVSNPSIFNVIKISSTVVAAITGAAWGALMLTEAIYKLKYNNVPAFHAFADNFTAAVKWPEIDNIELKSASLADSFIIGLNLT